MYDVKRELKPFYAPRNREWALVDMPPQQFIAVDGHGDPNTSPDYANAVRALYAVDAALAKKKLPTIAHVRHETLAEGRSAQVLHVGSYDDETPLMARLHDEYLPANNLTPAGPHHEIYLGDPRRTAPEKLRTVIRQPVG